MERRTAKRVALSIVGQLLSEAITSKLSQDYLNQESWAELEPDLQNALKELAGELSDQVARDYGYIIIDLHGRD